MVWLFKSSRLSVALTLSPAPVFFEIGNTLFNGINQQLKISLLKCIDEGGIFLTRLKFDRVLSVRTTWNVDSLNENMPSDD